jgi:hypothetical protein
MTILEIECMFRRPEKVRIADTEGYYENFTGKILYGENLASVRDATFSLESGRIFWLGGVWEDGLWEDGVWEIGEWIAGFWQGGTWLDGIWHSGTWFGGDWHQGVWEFGVCKGERRRWAVTSRETYARDE